MYQNKTLVFLHVCNSDKLKTTINSLKQCQDSQRELSFAVSSLQAFQKIMSLDAGKCPVFACVISSPFFKVFSGTTGSHLIKNLHKAYLCTDSKMDLRLITLIKSALLLYGTEQRNR